MSETESFFRVEKLAKHFGATRVFDDLSFGIDRGEFITLLGPSGCGKSTLLRCLAGLETPDAGTIFVGADITNVKAQKRGIGMVFQSYALFPNMTAAENIAFGLKMNGVPAAETAKKVSDAVALVELSGNEKKYPHQLSGGQKQRVALARALVTQPRILLLDEPLSALDARIRRNLREQIRSIQKDLHLTTVFVTHDQEEAMTVSDRIFLMNRGAIVQQGTPEEVYLNPADQFAARFIGSYNLLTKAEAKVLLEFDSPEDLVARAPGIGVCAGRGRQVPRDFYQSPWTGAWSAISSWVTSSATALPR
ncbi:MAG: ABC transporter ATP-binding protein [Duodenibacillus massiliensis]